jgi:predicted nuclease with TOPRIM domain
MENEELFEKLKKKKRKIKKLKEKLAALESQRCTKFDSLKNILELVDRYYQDGLISHRIWSDLVDSALKNDHQIPHTMSQTITTNAVLVTEEMFESIEKNLFVMTEDIANKIIGLGKHARGNVVKEQVRVFILSLRETLAPVSFSSSVVQSPLYSYTDL